MTVRVCVCVCVCDAQIIQILHKLQGSTAMRPNHVCLCVCVCVCQLPEKHRNMTLTVGCHKAAISYWGLCGHIGHQLHVQPCGVGCIAAVELILDDSSETNPVPITHLHASCPTCKWKCWTPRYFEANPYVTLPGVIVNSLREPKLEELGWQGDMVTILKKQVWKTSIFELPRVKNCISRLCTHPLGAPPPGPNTQIG